MQQPRTAISLTGVTKRYGEPPSQEYALRGVDLEVKQGEVLLLMGPSGSGKTTLLSIMGCILSPTDGDVVVAGQSVTGLSTGSLAKVRLDNLGFVFQEYNLFPTLSVIENVMVALDLRGMNRKDSAETAMSALENVGMAEKAHVYPETLSGGQKQRLAIARALAGSPKVILADEPTAALDSENGRLVMDLMSSLADDGTRSVVVVTHDQRTFEFADRIITIEDGLLLPPREMNNIRKSRKT
ncbi:ABC transporter ATP-binding protein [Desulfovibrio oxyclinae]|uniref:ABC transporter ATP-binding protein n=1 Tax=Desulfovibrio oxyclinae TaxID=63560 RepID=UPI000375C83C|nr:ABC transporter ATP-binding protein [Desulfovibrio oxyclinae]